MDMMLSVLYFSSLYFCQSVFDKNHKLSVASLRECAGVAAAVPPMIDSGETQEKWKIPTKYQSIHVITFFTIPVAGDLDFRPILLQITMPERR